MYRAGLANQPTSVARDDGLALSGAFVSAAVRCAPPANKPTPAERERCLPYLRQELVLVGPVRVIVALGRFAYDVVTRLLAVRPRPRFGHGVEAIAPNGMTLLGSFHPSQQNTFTGKLTAPMLDAIFERASTLADRSP
jgi:uracil-DNA glycosylase family 4